MTLTSRLNNFRLFLTYTANSFQPILTPMKQGTFQGLAVTFIIVLFIIHSNYAYDTLVAFVLYFIICFYVTFWCLNNALERIQAGVLFIATIISFYLSSEIMFQYGETGPDVNDIFLLFSLIPTVSIALCLIIKR